MPTITVKNIPPDLYERLKLAAEANHRSINSEIIVCIERSLGGRPLDVEQFLERARRLREQTAHYQLSDEDFNEAKTSGRP